MFTQQNKTSLFGSQTPTPSAFGSQPGKNDFSLQFY